jgi:hypothetical protein
LLDIWVSRRASRDLPWEPPVNLGPTINSSASEHCPLPTPDGRTLIFVSTRDGGDNDFYISHRRDKRDDLGWGTPVPIDAINTEFDDFTPGYFENEDGTGTFYFASNRLTGVVGANDIYVSAVDHGRDDDDSDDDDGDAGDGDNGDSDDGDDEWTFGPPALIPELSSNFSDMFPTPRRDGLELTLTSNRDGFTGTVRNADLWVSTRASTSDPWSAPTHMGAVINSAGIDGRGVITFDKRSLYLYSDRTGTVGGTDVWVSTRSKRKGKKD